MAKSSYDPITRSEILGTRFFIFPIKLAIAYLVYAYFEHGLFYIIAYILFSMSDEWQFNNINIKNLNGSVNNAEHNNKLMQRKNDELSEKVNDLTDQIQALELQMSDMKENEKIMAEFSNNMYNELKKVKNEG
ncbi:MAG: hypothetical protein PQ612_09005 [Rickettsiales bacterium]|nr:hypothetical protein [Pseudomonadota bacterium]MDG4544111.1 hypothetical protein [Rickettsiales bacterium]MDG4546292.1 hypothetical protein [Rickettsiales bacterium]MDG4548435.1 hypothetical protein [Rickettsiales bacterium]